MGSWSSWVDHYLRILQLSYEPPSLQFLRRLIRAQITTFPFENVSKITSEVHFEEGLKLPSMAEHFLDGYERNGFGGTCFALNWLFKSLLQEIGFVCYAVMLSRQHMAIIVCLDGLNHNRQKFYVDCGATAPLFEPIDLESRDHHCARFGNERVVIRHRISKSVHRFERYRNGVLTLEPWYFNIEQPQTLIDFLPVIQSSYEQNRPYMSSLRCHKFGNDLNYCISLKNNRFQICYRDGRVFNHFLQSIEEIKEIIQYIFGIDPSFAELAVTKIHQNGANIFTYALSNP